MVSGQRSAESIGGHLDRLAEQRNIELHAIEYDEK